MKIKKEINGAKKQEFKRNSYLYELAGLLPILGALLILSPLVNVISKSENGFSFHIAVFYFFWLWFLLIIFSYILSKYLLK